VSDGQTASAPDNVLELVAGALAARAGDEAVATVIGVHLPLLHRNASMRTATHPELHALIPGRATPAAAWLRQSGYAPLLAAPSAPANFSTRYAGTYPKPTATSPTPC
jgi:hypothetical protein